MLNYVIVVDDADELKTVSAVDIDKSDAELGRELEALLNRVLDQRAIEAGEYDPSDNDTPIVVI